MSVTAVQNQESASWVRYGNASPHHQAIYSGDRGQREVDWLERSPTA